MKQYYEKVYVPTDYHYIKRPELNELLETYEELTDELYYYDTLSGYLT